MAEQFEPMGVGGILDKTFKIYKNNFVRFITIVALVQIPVWLIGFLYGNAFGQDMPAEGGSDPNFALIIGGVIIFVLLAMLAQFLSNAALIRSVSGAYLGEDVSVGQAYATALPRVLTILVASILTGIVVGIGFLLLVVPGIIFALWFTLITQCIVVEKTGAIKGMKRSKALVSGNLGKTFVLGFMVLLIAAIGDWLFKTAGVAIGAAAGADSAAIMIRALAGLVGNILLAPIGAVAFILLYYDLRIRKEGFDLTMLSQQMGRGTESG